MQVQAQVGGLSLAIGYNRHREIRRVTQIYCRCFMKLGEVKIMQIILTCSVLCLGLVYRLVTSFFESTRHPDMFATSYCRPLTTSTTYYDLKQLFKKWFKRTQKSYRNHTAGNLSGYFLCVENAIPEAVEAKIQLKHWLIEKKQCCAASISSHANIRRSWTPMNIQEVSDIIKEVSIMESGYHDIMNPSSRYLML